MNEYHRFYNLVNFSFFSLIGIYSFLSEKCYEGHEEKIWAKEKDHNILFMNGYYDDL